MQVIPAIDIIDGKAVRLYKGDYDKKEVVGEDIVSIAKSFDKDGAKVIHLVDLDGAKLGKPVNVEIIKEVVKNVDAKVQVGGGIRTYEDVKLLLDLGVSRVILGTVAIENIEFLEDLVKEFKEKIAVAIDVENGYLKGRGWLSTSEIYYLDMVKKLENIGVDTIVVTDISKDGTLEGANIDIMRELSENTKINLVASGGVKNMDDFKKLKVLNIYGAIAGKAIYSGNITVKKAQEYCEGDEI